MALKIYEKFLGRNDLLDITIKSYKYDVVLIDMKGEVKQYLAGPFPVAVSREKLREAPRIEARWVNENLIAVKNPQKKGKYISFRAKKGCLKIFFEQPFLIRTFYRLDVLIILRFRRIIGNFHSHLF